MTSATEKLRRMLDERGVKWWPMRNNGYYEERDTEFVANGKNHTAHEWGDGLAVYNLTPEQAIAATLGGANVDDVLALLDEMNEQGRIEYADYSQLHDAIAATLGRGTCRNEWAEFGKFRCSECWMQVGSISTNTTAPRPIKFCPNCGREVVGA